MAAKKRKMMAFSKAILFFLCRVTYVATPTCVCLRLSESARTAVSTHNKTNERRWGENNNRETWREVESRLLHAARLTFSFLIYSIHAAVCLLSTKKHLFLLFLCSLVQRRERREVSRGRQRKNATRKVGNAELTYSTTREKKTLLQPPQRQQADVERKLENYIKNITKSNVLKAPHLIKNNRRKRKKTKKSKRGERERHPACWLRVCMWKRGREKGIYASTKMVVSIDAALLQ